TPLPLPPPRHGLQTTRPLQSGPLRSLRTRAPAPLRRRATRSYSTALGGTTAAVRKPAPTSATVRQSFDKLLDQRRKLLQLYYDDKISADQFGEEQARITAL